MLQIIVWQLAALVFISSSFSKNPVIQVGGLIAAAAFFFMSFAQASYLP